jgi:hypothetical protein
MVGNLKTNKYIFEARPWLWYVAYLIDIEAYLLQLHFVANHTTNSRIRVKPIFFSL